MLHLQFIFVFTTLVVVVCSNELHHPRFRRETYGCSSNDKDIFTWNGGRTGEMKLLLPTMSTIVIELSKPEAEVNFYCLIPVSNTATQYTFKMNWCPSTDGIATLEYTLQYGNSIRAEFSSVMLNGVEMCVTNILTTPETTASITTSTTTTFSTTHSGSSSSPQCAPHFNYAEVLHSSILFYEAQRSGELPANNRIPWRKSSTQKDGNYLAGDLSGGYFDAGDYVKFNFPQAAAMTMLAWGMVEFSQGYKFAGEYKKGLDTLRWGMDYFMKCHTSPNELYAQVGNGYSDHEQWGRPEDITINRPCYKIDANKPGSDLAGEVAASLAASSIVFHDTHKTYSDELLVHAKELYDFANNMNTRGKYSDSIPEAADFYRSWSYVDELALAATWLYKATKNSKYLSDAETHWNNMQHLHDSNELSWDNKARAVAILLAKITNKANYISNAENFCSVAKNEAPRTPSGMVFIQKWGSNRHAANIAFACLVLSKQSNTSDYTDFSRQQIHIMLGQNDQTFSFVIGFGSNYPLKPHHRSSSCPTSGTCDWSNYNAQGPNPQILVGALVGGPKDLAGSYVDSRSDFITNEVAIDYNAGFQSAIAGLLDTQSKC